jgi:hypothetical protein
MNPKELHAYIQGPDLTAVIRWIESLVTDLGPKETLDLTEALGIVMVRFDGKHDFMLLEQHVGTGWLELEIRIKSPDSIFGKWDNIQFGERLVDDLGGITLVDCGGKYVHPLAPYKVRISTDKLELVELPPEIGDPFDESLTKLIKKR